MVSQGFSSLAWFQLGWSQFLLRNCSSAVVWIWNENGVGNTAMVWVLLSWVYPDARSFPRLLLCQWEVPKGNGEGAELGQGTELAKEIIHSTECPSQL